MGNRSDDSNGFGNFSLETIETVQSERVSSSRVIDLRRHPRVDTCFQAWMISEDGKLEGLIVDLSRGGLCFEADSKLPDLLPSEIVEICFNVPSHNAADMPIVVQARTVYVIESNEGSYKCGVEFMVFAEGEQALEDYLHSWGVAK